MGPTNSNLGNTKKRYGKILKVIFDGIALYQKDVDLILKVRATNVFDGGEKEYLEMSIKKLNERENDEHNDSE